MISGLDEMDRYLKRRCLLQSLKSLALAVLALISLVLFGRIAGSLL